MQFLLSLLFTYFILRNTQTLAFVDKSIEPRIIGGNVASPGQFPFTAVLNIKTNESTSYVCAGSLIDKKWILTSALCLTQAVNVTVNLGSTSLDTYDPNRVTVDSSTFFIHPEYDITTFQNDLGLIYLESEVSLSEYVQPIKLASFNLPTILKPTIMGWGQTVDGNETYSPDLIYASVRILTNLECQAVYGSIIQDNMVCVKGSDNEGACYGDTGSPLVVRPLGSAVLEHVGLSSFFSGHGCESADPSGYTRTYPYVSWIKNITGLV